MDLELRLLWPLLITTWTDAQVLSTSKVDPSTTPSTNATKSLRDTLKCARTWKSKTWNTLKPSSTSKTILPVRNGQRSWHKIWKIEVQVQWHGHPMLMICGRTCARDNQMLLTGVQATVFGQEKHLLYLPLTPDGSTSPPTPSHSTTSCQDCRDSSQVRWTFMLPTLKVHLLIGFMRDLMITTSGHSLRKCGDGSSGTMANTSCLQTSQRLDGTMYPTEELATRQIPGKENSSQSTFTTTIFTQMFTKSQEKLVEKREPTSANSFQEVLSTMRKDGDKPLLNG